MDDISAGLFICKQASGEFCLGCAVADDIEVSTDGYFAFSDFKRVLGQLHDGVRHLSYLKIA